MRRAYKRLSYLLLIMSLVLVAGCSNGQGSLSATPQTDTEEVANPTITFPELSTNTQKSSIDLDKVLDGGPQKDGIPAIKTPNFVSQADAKVTDETLGVLVNISGEKRFYPYNILAWHEIVNDQMGGQAFAVTFCPLCGSAIVFDRQVNGETLEFGVSGLLYESNLLMYDNATESLWSQALGKAVVGEHTNAELTKLPFQRITFSELKDSHPEALVLKRVTNAEIAKQYPQMSIFKVLSPQQGDSRNYDSIPYSEYLDKEDTLFPVSVKDNRFPAKKIMYVTQFKDKSIAIPFLEAQDEATISVEDQNLVLRKDGNQIFILNPEGQQITGYFEMWFSWATHHQEDGIVWEQPLKETTL